MLQVRDRLSTLLPWLGAVMALGLASTGLWLLTGAVEGGASYALAAWSVGNPVLPLFNAVFQSPYFAPVNFSDARSSCCCCRCCWRSTCVMPTRAWWCCAWSRWSQLRKGC